MLASTSSGRSRHKRDLQSALDALNGLTVVWSWTDLDGGSTWIACAATTHTDESSPAAWPAVRKQFIAAVERVLAQLDA